MNESTKIKNDLTSRQWVLYNFLKNIYLQDDKKYNTLYDIYVWFREDLSFDNSYQQLDDEENYPFLRPNMDWNNQRARRMLTDDIEALKNSKVLHANVISNNKGVKIANEQENRELLKEKISILKSLQRVNFQLGRTQLNGQERLVFNQECEFIDTYLRKYEVVI